MNTETKQQRRQWSQRHLLVLERELKRIKKELAEAKAALAEAVKGLEKMRDYADQHVSGYSHVCNCYWPQELREQAKDILASIEAHTAPAEGAER